MFLTQTTSNDYENLCRMDVLGLEDSIVCWLNSSVALYWILGGGELKQFVGNRVRKIREHQHVKWRHVPTDQNPADIASRSGLSMSRAVFGGMVRTGSQILRSG